MPIPVRYRLHPKLAAPTRVAPAIMTVRDERGRVRLETIEVAEPCTEDWDAMPGDEKVRLCGLCDRHVYHLSAMTRDEAEALVSEREGRICVRFVRRADGTVTTSDCAPDRMAALRRAAKKSLALGATVAAGLMALVGAVGVANALGVFADALDEPVEVEVMGEEMPMPEPWPEPLESERVESEPPPEPGTTEAPTEPAPEAP
jgi:hypothetical protein